MFERISVFIRNSFEKGAYGVCAYLGERLQIPVRDVRKYFIFTSILTFGSPTLIYLIITFWLNFKKIFRSNRNPIWE
jgi:phage shock protein PspC (stress-responsive transcriptional regulator)